MVEKHCTLVARTAGVHEHLPIPALQEYVLYKTFLRIFVSKLEHISPVDLQYIAEGIHPDSPIEKNGKEKKNSHLKVSSRAEQIITV